MKMEDMKPESYDHKQIEKKWQKIWEEQGIYKSSEDPSKPKCYVLNEFPYPSGDGLHIGHPRGYIAADVYSRYKRMNGYSVLHPFGWDAFGLPAENYAIKNKIHPSVAVTQNIARFRAQSDLMGFDFDWSREVNTTDPSYYKWTQWIFLQMWKKGLAYESNEPINWCPSCKTGLANEDLEHGKCERCGSVIEKKRIRQWVLSITKYADRLLDDLEELDWPENIKQMQRDWIGRSHGLVFKSKIRDTTLEIETFSAHYEQSYADTFIAIAPDHQILSKIIKGVSGEEELRGKIEEMNVKRLKEKYVQGEIEGVFTGRYAIDPLGGEDMPIWVANFVISEYGTGIVRCSKYDPRDLAFATKYHIPLRDAMVSHDAEHFVSKGLAKKSIMYKLRDWIFSRQRYWGEPIPLIHCQNKCGVVAVPDQDLPVKLPDVKNYEPTGTGESPLAVISEWVNVMCPICGGEGKRETNTMPQWAGSSWYWLRYMDPNNINSLVSNEKEKYWAPVDLYIGGNEHATRHLIYARFWHKFLFDIGAVSSKEPFKKRIATGIILASDNRKMSKRWGNVINPDDVIDKFGADTFRLYEMFLGPFSETILWNDDAIIGPRRFLERVWKLVTHTVIPQPADKSENIDSVHEIDKFIKKISENIENFKLNTTVSELMKVLNVLEGLEPSTYDLETFLKLLAPFAPHISEELWYTLGHQDSIHTSTWPVAKKGDGLNVEKVIAIPVQIDGKIRGSIYLEQETSEADARKIALHSRELAIWLKDKEMKKFIYKKGKVVSIVT